MIVSTVSSPRMIVSTHQRRPGPFPCLFYRRQSGRWCNPAGNHVWLRCPQASSLLTFWFPISCGDKEGKTQKILEIIKEMALRLYSWRTTFL
jgi:hypothetical protein